MDQEGIDDMRPDNKIQNHWRVVLKDNKGEVYDDKLIIHANKWDFYINNKQSLIKGWCCVEVSGFCEKNFFGSVR